MHLNRLDLNLLVALDALLAEKNVTKAGDRLYLSQPAMSGALQRLREYFDDELLVRVGRTMELTPRAMYLAGPVREILLNIQATVEAQPTFDPSKMKRDFSVVMSDYVLFTLMPEVNRQLRDTAPGINLHHDDRLIESPELLNSGEVDLVCMPPNVFRREHTSVDYKPLFYDQWVCVMSKENPACNESLTADGFMQMPHVMMRATCSDKTFSVEELTLQALGMDLRTLNIHATAPGFISMLLLVPGSNAVAMVHRRLFDAFSQILEIIAVEPPMEIPAVEVGMFWSRRIAYDPAQVWLRQLFLNAAANL